MVKFNTTRLMQNLQKVSNNLLGNAILLNSTRRGGGFGMSVWGCRGGMMGGCTPPLNIFHPMYADNQYNPYLTQAGMNIAEVQAHEMFESIYANQKDLQSQYPTSSTPQIDDTALGKEFEAAINEDKQFKFVNEKWEEVNNKEDKTTEEQSQLDDAYNKSAIASGKSFISHLDKKYGNNDNEMTLDEYTDYLIETKLSEDATSDEKAEMRIAAKNAFASMDLDENKKLDYKEMSALTVLIDSFGDGKKDGKINGADNAIISEELMLGDGSIKEELKMNYRSLFKE